MVSDSENANNEDFSSDELDPVLVVPNPRVYRGSIVALLIGSVFAIWILIIPPGGSDLDSPPQSLSKLQIAQVESMAMTPVPLATITPIPTVVNNIAGIPTSSATTAPTATVSIADTTASTSGSSTSTDVVSTPEPTPEPTPEASNPTYTVQAGDSLYLIAEYFLPSGKDLAMYVDEIAQLNEISDITQIQVGQVLKIPAQ